MSERTADLADHLDASGCRTLGEYAERHPRQEDDQKARQRQREFEIASSFCDRCEVQIYYHADLGEPIRANCDTCLDYCVLCCRCEAS